jgi:polyisoprenoid-binding protein YceI
MRNIAILLAFAVTHFSCQDKPSGEKVETVAPSDTLPVLPAGKNLETLAIEKGQINWTASKIGGQHMGTIEISNGQITIDGNNLITGQFDMDMNTIKNTDLEGTKKEKLENHLKSGDFFDVAQYPTARFVVTVVSQGSPVSMATHTITGDLTIKNITRSTSIPANIAFVGDKIMVTTPVFTIDRTDWRLKYRSAELGTAPDLLIHDDISLVVTFEAIKNLP